jgi:hypothetical protein
VRPVDEEDILQRLPEVEYGRLRPEFRKEVCAVQSRLLSLADLAGPKKVNGEDVGGMQQLMLLEAIVEELNSGQVMNIRGAWSSCASKVCMELVNELIPQGTQAVVAASQKLPIADAELSELLEQNRQSLRTEFYSRALGDQEVREEAWNELILGLQQWEEQLHLHNRSLADEQLRSALAEYDRWLEDGTPWGKEPGGDALQRLIAKGLPYDTMVNLTNEALERAARSGKQGSPEKVPEVAERPPQVAELPTARNPVRDGNGVKVVLETFTRYEVQRGSDALDNLDSQEGIKVGHQLTISHEDHNSETRMITGMGSGSLYLDEMLHAYYPADSKVVVKDLGRKVVREVARPDASPAATDDEPPARRGFCAWLCGRSSSRRKPPSPSRHTSGKRREPDEGPVALADEDTEPVDEGPQRREVLATDSDRPLGITFATLPPERTEVDSVDQGTWGARVGLQSGDIVLQANGEDLETMDASRFSEMRARRPLRLLVESRSNQEAAPLESEAAISRRVPEGVQDLEPELDEPVLTAEYAQECEQALTIMFTPGKLGLQYSEIGVVGQVRPDGQCDLNGVKRGWYIDRVNQEEFRNKTQIEKLVNGPRNFMVTFRRDAAKLSMAFPDLDFRCLQEPRNKGLYHSMHDAVMEVACHHAHGDVSSDKVCVELAGGPALRATVFLLPHGEHQGLLTLLQQVFELAHHSDIDSSELQHVQLPHKIVQRLAALPGIEGMASKGKPLRELRVIEMTVTFGDEESPRVFSLPDAKASIS